MDALLGKLTNLAYEVFGVIIPGLIFGLLLLMWWLALGPLAPKASGLRIPQLHLTTLVSVITAVPGGRGVAAAIAGLMVCYLLGHSVNWPSKARPKGKGGWKARSGRIWTFLTFRVPKPDASYDMRLQPLFEAICPKWTHDSRALSWREFYPLAKTVLANTGRYSLVSTYQNKYTLHRSIAAGAAFIFWLCTFSLAGAAVARKYGVAEEPDWLVLFALSVGALVLVTAFSGSYSYAWTLWGDTILTESYALEFGPKVGPRDESAK